MASKARIRDVELADTFLADQKTRVGDPPEFGPKTQTSSRRSKERSEEAFWPIANSMGIVETGQLRINATTNSDKPFTIAVIFRGNCIYRLDFVAATICHPNPLWSKRFGCAPSIAGPHCHTWVANRSHIIEQDCWELPARVAVSPRIQRFGQAFAWLASEINIILKPGDRDFNIPEGLLL